MYERPQRAVILSKTRDSGFLYRLSVPVRKRRVQCLGMQENALQARFTAAFDEYLDPIFAYFAYRLNDRDRAKELAQETFMKAWMYARSGKEIQEMRPFLYTVAANLYKNELRGRKAVVSLEVIIETYGFEPAAKDLDPEASAELALLMRRVDVLPERERELLMLRYVDGLSLREVADTLGITETNAGVRVHRAIKKLRDLYEGTT